MFVSQIFKSVCTSEQSDQILSVASQFLPIDRPSKSDQTAWMGTHVKLYLLLDTGSNNWAATRENLSSGFTTKQDSNQSPQLQRLSRKLKFRYSKSRCDTFQ